MDNSLGLYKKKVEQMIDELKKFSSRLNHHVIIEPRNTIEEAVRYGFPSDKALQYLDNFYSRHVSVVEDVMQYIEKDCIPYLSDVAFYIESAMNRGGSSTPSTGGGSFSRNKSENPTIEKNNRDLALALGIEQGPPMSISEADKQHANPKHKNNQKEYVQDNQGAYVKVQNSKDDKFEYINIEEWIRRGFEPSLFNKQIRYEKNPYYQYSVNCATCAPAYVLRLRGLDIQAKGNPQEDDKMDDGKTKQNLNYWISQQHSFDVWQNTDGSVATPTYTVEWMNKNGISEMTPEYYKQYFNETCKDEGVYILTLNWVDGGGHATILQRDKDGLHYIEPQAYDESSVDGRRSINDLVYKIGLSKTPLPKKGIMRVDNKIFNVKYASLFEKRQI